MNKQNTKKPLGELISRAVGRENLKFDFSRWKVQHQKEIQDFQVQIKHSGINNPVLTNIWRTIMKSSITKIAAAAAIIMIVLVGLHRLGGSIDGATVAWADVLENMEAAQTVTFTLESKSQNENGEDWWGKGEIKIKGPYRLYKGTTGHRRASGTPREGPILSIVDLSRQNRFILLYPQLKWAYTGDHGGNDALLTYDGIKKDFRDGTEEDLGKVNIGGRDAVCFKVSKDSKKITVWADPNSALPIRIERTATDRVDESILRNITFGVELDDELFNMTVPDGYASVNMTTDEFKIPFELTEKHLIEGLAVYGKYLGKFPTWYAGGGRPGPEAREKLITEMKQDYDPSAEESVKTMLGSQFAKRLPESSDWQYVGEDVKLGDSNTPVCWWKPQGSKTYRVVYGDLSIRDAEPNNLPEVPWLKK